MKREDLEGRVYADMSETELAKMFGFITAQAAIVLAHMPDDLACAIWVSAASKMPADVCKIRDRLAAQQGAEVRV